jgi:hypothetical protein
MDTAETSSRNFAGAHAETAYAHVMKSARVLSFAAIIAILSSAASARDLKTVSGDVFKEITVTKKDATGLQITHQDGATFVDFRNLAAAEQKEFGYDPAAYAEGWKQKIAADKLRREQTLAARQAAAARDKAQAAATPRDLAPRTYTPTNQTGLEVTIEAPGFRYGPYDIDGRGFSNTIPPSQGGNLVPVPYFPYDGRNGAYWGPTIIRRR